MWGCVSLLLATVVALGWTPGERRRATDFAEAASLAESRVAHLSSARPDDVRALPPSARFVAGFAPLSTRQEQIATLLSMAATHHLQPQRSEFQQSREGLPGLMRLRITMPVSGPYASVRGFIGDALEQNPTLSLDSLRLRRDSALATTVVADLIWSIYLQDDPDMALSGSASSSAR